MFSVKFIVLNLGEKKMTNTERTTLPMQNMHSKSDTGAIHKTQAAEQSSNTIQNHPAM
jgi:hypothetical protein